MCCPSRTFLGRRKKVTMMSSISSPAFHPFDVLREFAHNPFTWFKGKGLLLAAGDRTQCNAMTIGWGALGNSWVSGNATLTVYVTPKRYTYGLMERARYFTVMSFDEAQGDILDYMGCHSGRDGDKAAALGLHTLYTERETPYFAEAVEVYECELLYHAPLDPAGFSEAPRAYYAQRTSGIHTQYTGQIIQALRRGE